VANPHPDDPVKAPGTTEQSSEPAQKVAVAEELPKAVTEPETEQEPAPAPAKYVPAPEKVQARQKTLAPEALLFATPASGAELTKSMQSDVKVQAEAIRAQSVRNNSSCVSRRLLRQRGAATGGAATGRTASG
jgi:hypothetical protein